MVHQDAEIVPEEGAGDAQRERRGDDKELADRKHDDGNGGRIGLWEQRYARLVGECTLVPGFRRRARLSKKSFKK